MLRALITAAIAGLIVYLIGTLFDKTPNNQYAGVAGLIVFVIVFLASYGIIE